MILLTRRLFFGAQVLCCTDLYLTYYKKDCPNVICDFLPYAQCCGSAQCKVLIPNQYARDIYSRKRERKRKSESQRQKVRGMSRQLNYQTDKDSESE